MVFRWTIVAALPLFGTLSLIKTIILKGALYIVFKLLNYNSKDVNNMVLNYFPMCFWFSFFVPHSVVLEICFYSEE